MNSLSSTSAFDPMQNRGLSTGGGGANERMFSRALRHSRRVRLLRVAVPAAIGVLLVGFILAAWLDPLRLVVRLPGIDGKVVISGTKITMQAPKLSGFTRDSRWYEFTAHSAAQDISKPNVVELREIQAKIQAEDKSTVNLTAVDGEFDRKSGVLKLGRNIVLQSSGGYEVLLSEAVVDTGSGDVVSDRPVEVRMLQGKLNANRLEVVKGGEVVRFEGGVRMDLPPEAMNAESQPAGQP